MDGQSAHGRSARRISVARKELNGCCHRVVTNAGRRRTVVHAARDRKARPDVATGGDPTAMTMRVVGEAVEPRARTYIYAHKNQGLHKRGQTSRAMAAWIAGAMLWQLVRAARGPTMFGRAVGTTGAHGTLCAVVFF